MILTQEQLKEFEDVTRPLIKFLNDHFHPHVTVIVDNTSAELSEGIATFRTEDYLKD